MKTSYTLEETAESLAISRRTVERLVKARELQSYRVGHSRRIAAEELERLKKNGSAQK